MPRPPAGDALLFGVPGIEAVSLLQTASAARARARLSPRVGGTSSPGALAVFRLATCSLLGDQGVLLSAQRMRPSNPETPAGSTWGRWDALASRAGR
jgi:hypothetical protein